MSDKILDLSHISEEFDPTVGCFESVIKCDLYKSKVYIEVGDRITPEISDIHCICISDDGKTVFLIKNTYVYPEGTDIDQIKDYGYIYGINPKGYVYKIILKDNTVYYVNSDRYIDIYINLKYDGYISFGGNNWKLSDEIMSIEYIKMVR